MPKIKHEDFDEFCRKADRIELLIAIAKLNTELMIGRVMLDMAREELQLRDKQIARISYKNITEDAK